MTWTAFSAFQETIRYVIQVSYCAFGTGSRAISFSFTILIGIYISVQTIYNLSTVQDII